MYKENEMKLLELKNVWKSFGDKDVLKGISFSVQEGEIIGYIGPNGAGKSTTVKLILGLLELDQGDIFLRGQRITTEDVTYKSQIGYVPEQTSIYETLTLEEYILFSGQLYGLSQETIMHRAKPMLEIFELEDSRDKLLGSFSKGMRQKTLIIASLIHNPRLIFWDEPLSGLDANTVLLVKEIMLKLSMQGKTIFYSSHNMDTVEKLSHRIVLLNDGEIIANGTLEEIQGAESRSLELFFNEVTGFTQHDAKAKQFVQALEEA